MRSHAHVDRDVRLVDRRQQLGGRRRDDGDRLVLEAEADLIVGLTACSAPQSNNFAFKPIQYEIA